MFLATAGEVCGYIDGDLTNFIHTIIVIIKIATTVLLVIFGMLDLAKSVIASKEDEIKKGQQVFIKRCIAAVIVFFVFSIVQLLTGLIANEDSEIWSCASAIMNGTNKKVSSTPTTNNNQNVQKENCCAKAGGKINANGECASWFDMDSNGNATNRNEMDENVYNQCMNNKTVSEEKKQSCCTQAGGKMNVEGYCSSWFEMDAQNNPIKKHDVDGDAYNKCIK